MATCFVISAVFSPNDNNTTSALNTEKIFCINIEDKNTECIQNTQKEQKHKTMGKIRFKTEQKPTYV
jgi:hypothetical protein